ncbi:MAG: hypothetical protein MI922_15195 [Bacteroidales bacterium]|nr:hypothetical protein [Bacteroidales bacterium]
MKKLKLSLFTISVATLILSSCGGIQKMVDSANTVSYDVNPSPLETHAGEVEVTIKSKFPEKYFNKKAILTVTPVIKHEGGQTEFESFTLQGEAVEANNKVIPVAGGDHTFTGKISYKPEMLKSDLYVEMSAQLGDSDPIEIPGIKIAAGVIATPTLVQIDPKAVAVGDKFERITPQQFEADIHYVINKANVRSSELKSDDVKTFQDNLASATENERISFKGAKISSYASPDGTVDLNTKLSGNRGSSAEKYLQKTLKKLKVDEASQNEFLKVVSTAEDWDGFQEEMKASDIKDKELILRVLEMYSDPVVREKEIKNISEAFEEIKVEVLPKLRRSQMYIDIEKVGYSDEEILALVSEAPDTLNLEELLYGASLVETNEQKLAIYKKASEKYPESFRAKNNVGYILLEMGNTAEAKTAFEEAQSLKDNDVVKNNLGAIALIEADMATAEDLFTSAMGAGEVVNYNLGIIKIKQADYTAAVNYFGNEPSFNAALAQLLNGDTEKSITTLTEMADSEDAMVHYLKAVAGARAGREELVLAGMRRALELDSSLKDYAKKDAEFRNFITGEGLSGILQ